MLTKNDLNQIRKVVKEEADPIKKDFKEVKKQLDTVEIKVELVNKRVDQAQEETINALSELIQEGYNSHEKRIKKLENLESPQTQ